MTNVRGTASHKQCAFQLGDYDGTQSERRQRDLDASTVRAKTSVMTRKPRNGERGRSHAGGQWAHGENNIDTLTISVAGRYQAILPITRESN